MNLLKGTERKGCVGSKACLVRCLPATEAEKSLLNLDLSSLIGPSTNTTTDSTAAVKERGSDT